MTSGSETKEITATGGSSNSGDMRSTDSPAAEPELDDFGLPKRPVSRARPPADTDDDSDDDGDTFHDAEASAAPSPIKNGKVQEKPAEIELPASQTSPASGEDNR